MRILTAIIIVVLFASCTVHLIDPKSFKSQVLAAPITDTSLHIGYGLVHYALSNTKLKARRISVLETTDKNGKRIVLKNISGQAIRVTDKGGKRDLMYVSSIQANDSVFSGYRSLFLKTQTRLIPWNSVVKVEI